MIQRLQSLSGVQRRLVIGLTWLAAALYALAPAVPQQYMPTMAAGMHHATPSAMHHAMADMPDDCGMDAADMPDHSADAKPAHTANHDCPICKVAASVVVLVAPLALSSLTPDVQVDVVAGIWLPPSQRIFAARPRGPPSQV